MQETVGMTTLRPSETLNITFVYATRILDRQQKNCLTQTLPFFPILFGEESRPLNYNPHPLRSSANAATVATSDRKIRGPKETARKSAAANLGWEGLCKWKSRNHFDPIWFQFHPPEMIVLFSGACFGQNKGNTSRGTKQLNLTTRGPN